MKKINLLFLLSLGILLSSKAQSNFYTLLDSIYLNNPPFNEYDSARSGAIKEYDRIKTLYGPRLFPHGDYSIAAMQLLTTPTNSTLKAFHRVPAVWKPRLGNKKVLLVLKLGTLEEEMDKSIGLPTTLNSI